MYHVKTILKIVGSNKPEAVPCKHPSAVRMVMGRAESVMVVNASWGEREKDEGDRERVWR